MDEVMDIETPELEISGEESTETTQTEGAQSNPDKDIRGYRDWLKGLKTETPESAKWVRMARESHARMLEVQNIDPKGIDGLRERYAALDAIEHGDMRGLEAVRAIQDELRSVAETDELLASGDPKALEVLGDDFNEGLAKLTPHILDRIRDSNPEAYGKAVLPHFVEALKSSDLLSNHNAMVDVLSEKMPAWLPEEKKSEWLMDRLQKVAQLLGANSNWLNEQAKAAGELPKSQGTKDTSFETERAKFEEERTNHHWSVNIAPKLEEHGIERFNTLFKPYQDRLKLSKERLEAFRSDFLREVSTEASNNQDYVKQLSAYRKQGVKANPDSVLRLSKAEFDKHAKTVMGNLIKSPRYGFNLGSKTAAKTTSSAAQPQNRGTGQPKEFQTNVKPSRDTINFMDPRMRKPEFIYGNKYVLKDGRVAVYRP